MLEDILIRIDNSSIVHVPSNYLKQKIITNKEIVVIPNFIDVEKIKEVMKKVDVQLIRKKLKVHPLEYMIVCVGEHGACVLTSITDRAYWSPADSLEKIAEELRRSNEEFQKFASISSHELKAPIRIISNYCMFIKDIHHHMCEGPLSAAEHKDLDKGTGLD